MTYNQNIKLFKDFCDSHQMIKTYGTGEEWETEEILKPGILYPIFYAIPIDSTDLYQAKQRKFQILCFDIVNKDKSNEQEVLSDCEQIIDDFIRMMRNGSHDYELIGDPVLSPFKEKYGDFCAGWGTEIILEMSFNSNICGLPIEASTVPPLQNRVTIYDQDGNTVTELEPGDSYNVIIASGINEGGASQSYSMQVIDILS